MQATLCVQFLYNTGNKIILLFLYMVSKGGDLNPGMHMMAVYNIILNLEHSGPNSCTSQFEHEILSANL